MIESERTAENDRALQRRSYFSSGPASTPEQALRSNNAIRERGCIDREVQWVLDVAMEEDNNRARVGNSAQHLALNRKVVLNLLRKGKKSRGGVKARPKMAGWHHDDPLELLTLR